MMMSAGESSCNKKNTPLFYKQHFRRSAGSAPLFGKMLKELLPGKLVEEEGLF